jgi:hypothetical protein
VSFVATVSESASVTASAKPSSKYIPLGGFVQSSAVAAFIKMTSSSARRGSRLRKPKPSVTPGDLTRRFLELEQLGKRFLELHQLRNQVRELEHLAAIARKRGARCGRTGGAPRRK